MIGEVEVVMCRFRRLKVLKNLSEGPHGRYQSFKIQTGRVAKTGSASLSLSFGSISKQIRTSYSFATRQTELTGGSSWLVVSRGVTTTGGGFYFEASVGMKMLRLVSLLHSQTSAMGLKPVSCFTVFLFYLDKRLIYHCLTLFNSLMMSLTHTHMQQKITAKKVGKQGLSSLWNSGLDFFFFTADLFELQHFWKMTKPFFEHYIFMTSHSTPKKRTSWLKIDSSERKNI